MDFISVHLGLERRFPFLHHQRFLHSLLFSETRSAFAGQTFSGAVLLEKILAYLSALLYRAGGFLSSLAEVVRYGSAGRQLGTAFAAAP